MASRADVHPRQQPSRLAGINGRELAEQGIVIPPQQLAAILLGDMPAHFRRKNGNIWESRRSGGLIRLQWQAEQQRLLMTDITRGRQATLMILP